MPHGANLSIIFIIFTCVGPLQKGAAAVIQTQPTVSAAVGEDAPLSCHLLEAKDVQQVTWQKVLEKTERSICSYSEIFGQTVNPGFQDKVQFTEAGLQNNSIVIRNVTEQDEGCYLCLFNIYPDGALSAGTCLKLYELHGPFVDVRVVPPGSAVSCSATGRPAPTVTLTGPQQNLILSHYNATSVTSANGTVTVTTTALLSAPSSTQVGCSVSVVSAAPRELLVTVAAPRELLVTVAAPRESSAGGLDKQYESDGRGFRWPIFAVVTVLLCISFFLLGRRCQNWNKKPSQDTTDSQRVDSSPVSNQELRLRTSERRRQNSCSEADIYLFFSHNLGFISVLNSCFIFVETLPLRCCLAPSAIQNLAHFSMMAGSLVKIVLLGIFTEGGAALIETQQTVWAAVGEDARLSCQLTEAKDVLQVTWQKVLPDGEKNLATYTKKFGSRVRADLEETVDFQCEDLQSCSMVIRKATEQDEGCYRCLFNTYPEGALIGRTCLRLYELHGPFVDVRVVPPGSAVSCSATGRPAPTVTLTGPQQKLGFSHYNATSVTSANGTVTVTTTALLSAPSSTQVGCSVSVGSAAPRELLVTVAGLTSADGSEKQSGLRVESRESKDLSLPLILGVVAVAVACCGLAIITHWRYKKDKNRDDENKTPLKPACMHRSPLETRIKTPLTTVLNEIRQRSSTKKIPENKSLKGFSVAKKLFK
ncbi:uncharacterized protein FYW61_021847 [Anableps anableps]